MERSAHLQWCKDRALEYVDANDNKQAFASFMSDMGKHEETANHLALDMGMSMLMGGMLNSASDMRNWITGFN